MPSTGKEPARCGWVTDDPLYLAYHDEEWGVPVHDDTRLYLALYGGRSEEHTSELQSLV